MPVIVHTAPAQPAAFLEQAQGAFEASAVHPNAQQQTAVLHTCTPKPFMYILHCQSRFELVHAAKPAFDPIDCTRDMTTALAVHVYVCLWFTALKQAHAHTHINTVTHTHTHTHTHKHTHTKTHTPALACVGHPKQLPGNPFQKNSPPFCHMLVFGRQFSRVLKREDLQQALKNALHLGAYKIRRVGQDRACTGIPSKIPCIWARKTRRLGQDRACIGRPSKMPCIWARTKQEGLARTVNE